MLIKGHDKIAQMEIELAEQSRAKKRKSFSFWLPSTTENNWINKRDASS